MYGSENLIWLKNVKRKDGVGWAYEYKKCGETFFLNWPTKKKGSASTPKAGDIILLFQKPNEVSGKNNKHVHLTHLVSPVDEDVVPDLDHPDHLWCRKVKLIAIAAPIHAIPNPGYYSFFKPNRGLTNPIHNLTNNIGLTMAETQEDVFRLFHPFFCADLSAQLYLPKNPVGVYGEAEGDKIIRKHIIIEQIQRNSRMKH